MFNLGRRFADGPGRDIDLSKVHEWYKKALNAFHKIEDKKPWKYTEYRIGKMYSQGIGTEEDYEKATYWLTLSAEEGNEYAAYQLGKLYLKGEDIKKDIPLAIKWLYLSVERGNQYAQYLLGKICLMGGRYAKE